MKLSNQKAQGAIEYLLMMTIIILILINIVSPFGKMSQLVNSSIELATQGIECMAEKTCYPPDPCVPVYTQCGGFVAPPAPTNIIFIAFDRTEDFLGCQSCGGPDADDGSLPFCGPITTSSGDPKTCPLGYIQVYQVALPPTQDVVDCFFETPQTLEQTTITECTPTP